MSKRRVFLSYHGADYREAQRIANAIAAPDFNLDVFFAPWALRPGAFWIPALAEAIEQADAFVLLMGASNPGPWQMLEYYEAIDRKARQPEFPVIPVLLADNAPRLPFLGQIHWLQFHDATAREAIYSLYSAIRGEPMGPVTEPWRTVNPYRGLLAMTDADADFFFGRETLTEEVIDRIREGKRFLTLVGNSGVGKSSLVQAGVLATLRRQRWPGDEQREWPCDLRESRRWLFLAMKPGEQPLYELARAFVSQWTSPTDPERAILARQWEENLNRKLGMSDLLRATADAFEQQVGMPPRRFVLIVDQGEELYTRSPLRSARRFTDLMVEGFDRSSNLIVISSLRADHCGLLLEHEQFFARVTRVDVPALRQDGLRQVVSRPAEVLKASFEDESMIHRIAASTGRLPGALPLLSYLLEDMWKNMQRRGDATLRWTDYPGLVGVRGVLARRAEDYFKTRSPEGQVTLRHLFTLRLTHVPMHGEVVRRRAYRHECTDAEWSLVEDLSGADWRLLTTGEEAGESTAEVAHEVLLRDWGRLGDWLREEREFLLWMGRLEQAWKTWEETNRDEGALLHGLTLDRALNWLDAREVDLSIDHLSFIRKSEALREAQKQREVQQARDREKEQRTAKIRLAAISIVSMIFAVIASVLGYRAEEQREIAEIAGQHAKSERATAQRQVKKALRNQSRFLASESLKQTEKENNPVLGMLLALEGLPADLDEPDRPYVGQAEVALYRAAAAYRRSQTLKGHDATLWQAAFSPDGRLIVTASNDKTARLWDANTGNELSILKQHTKGVLHAAFDADSRRLVTASRDHSARVWDANTGKALAILKGHEDELSHAAFSPDGRLIVTASNDKTARLWDAVTGNPIETLEHDDVVWHAVFSPNGRLVATASRDKTARLWDAASGAQQAVLKGHESGVTHLTFSPDGRFVATASDDATVRLWDVDSEDRPITLRGHEDLVEHVVFSPDGGRLATASWDDTARIWDAVTGKGLATLRGHDDIVRRVAFSPDGQRVITGSRDHTARLWDANTGEALAVLKGHTDELWSAAFSPDGRIVVTASADKTARLWDAAIDEVIQTLGGHEGAVWHAAFRPDGERVVTASGDRTARLWDTTSGSELLVLEGHADQVSRAEFSPDGRRVVTASRDGTAWIWDADTGKELFILKGHEDEIEHATFSPDGQRIATASWDNTARIWDANTGEQMFALEGHTMGVQHVAFDADNRRVVTASRDRSARLWDANTGQALAILKGHEDELSYAAFSPDGQFVVTASADKTARLWNADSGDVVRILKGHLRLVEHAAFGPNGQRVVTASFDGTARLWDTGEGKLLAVLEGHEAHLFHVAFGPEGRRVVTASKDQTARIWDVRTGETLSIFKGHEAEVRRAAFSPDGRSVLTASEDKTARLWRVLPGGNELMSFAERIVPRELTPEERKRFFLD